MRNTNIVMLRITTNSIRTLALWFKKKKKKEWKENCIFEYGKWKNEIILNCILYQQRSMFLTKWQEKFTKIFTKDGSIRLPNQQAK